MKEVNLLQSDKFKFEFLLRKCSHLVLNSASNKIVFSTMKNQKRGKESYLCTSRVCNVVILFRSATHVLWMIYIYIYRMNSLFLNGVG